MVPERKAQPRMKVVHLTKTRQGGAGVAAIRTVNALIDCGIAAELWCEGVPPLNGPPSTSTRRWFLDKVDSLPTRLNFRRSRFSSWSNNWRSTALAPIINSTADLVHLHWIGQGFFSLDDLALLTKPIVWTMHDAWPFTGGCHYPAACSNFRTDCGQCPQLGSARGIDLSRRNHAKKKLTADRIAAWISPSAWLAGLAQESEMVPKDRLHVIPNTLDDREWPVISKHEARRSLGLPNDEIVVTAGAMDLSEFRKGNHLLHETLLRIAAHQRRPVTLVLFGKGKFPGPRVGDYAVRHVGSLCETSSIARIFSSADAMLMPSLQDNLPNVVLESQACGCPVVGLHSGGISEIVLEGVTGTLTSTLSSEGLADAFIRWIEEAPPRDRIIEICRKRQQSVFSPASHAAALKTIYTQVRFENRPLSGNAHSHGNERYSCE